MLPPRIAPDLEAVSQIKTKAANVSKIADDMLAGGGYQEDSTKAPVVFYQFKKKWWNFKIIYIWINKCELNKKERYLRSIRPTI